MRILATYFEHDADGAAKIVQIDVSRETGYWKLAQLLGSAHLAEVRLVGETAGAVGVARTIVVAGQYSRPPGQGERPRLRRRGDEAHPRYRPFIFISPYPDAEAFD
ncbi:MAG TPA: hypothetical protein PLF26_14780 [Blastocatellia bacterium]|nr:hypothetical protein [Blastocatellia bacterium]